MVWVYTIICVGSLWCIPEHDIRGTTPYPTKEACIEAAKEYFPRGFPSSEIWIVQCTEWEKP